MMEGQVALFPGGEGFAFVGDLGLNGETVTSTIQ